ncbi:hypothetical protein SAMN05421543_10294 [Alicyclobacillus macrosporangiidus]|uniref:Uncharacterized protein n=1 Tax=Alicyclobacillus macrosporangiidus TaxID=392015 RepID=A0A1I7G9X1_9BACL|nr:hypothetical protein SAMN05421543_10294 [Alicyclobacillus macrosporangiidus]
MTSMETYQRSKRYLAKLNENMLTVLLLAVTWHGDPIRLVCSLVL